MKLYDGFRVNYIVAQPTELCNLNCRYCYLPNRKSSKRMKIDVAENLAQNIIDLDTPVQLIWHGGEPLMCGVDHMSKLLSPFNNDKCKSLITQCIQTNAIPINSDWVEFFKEFNINVGVSIDGNKTHNKNRRFWSGRESFEKAIKGISLLKSSNIKYSIISVVGKDNLSFAKEIYNYLISFEPEMLGFNIEEYEGINQNLVSEKKKVEMFWSDLVNVWAQNPITPIREFNYIMPLLKHATTKASTTSDSKVIDIFPSVSVDGDIVLLSPEFVNANSEKYNDFIVGNILNDSIPSILSKISSINYISDFLEGVQSCKNSCEYFQFCGGGQASNKFFENKNISSTETNYCINTVKSLVNGILIDT